jgi:hypothetical protein
MNGNGSGNGEQEPTTQEPTTQDTGVGPFLGESLQRFGSITGRIPKTQLAELPDTKNIDAQIASFNQFLESASPLNEWHKNKVLARFGEMPQPVQGQMPQGAPMPQISPEPSSQGGQPETPSDKQAQKPAAQPAAAQTQPTGAPAQKQQYFLNPATGSYEPLQTQPPAAPAPTFLNPATGSYEPLQKQPPAGVQTTGGASTTGWNATTGTEFGAIDDPARGGYTEPGWNKGKWGGNIADKTTVGVALPQSVLSKYGDPNHSNFASDFNSKYQVAVRDPATGKTVYASLQDYGPSASLNAGIDMMWGTIDALGLNHDSAHHVEFQIVPRGSGDVASQ